MAEQAQTTVVELEASLSQMSGEVAEAEGKMRAVQETHAENVEAVEREATLNRYRALEEERRKWETERLDWWPSWMQRSITTEALKLRVG